MTMPHRGDAPSTTAGNGSSPVGTCPAAVSEPLNQNPNLRIPDDGKRPTASTEIGTSTERRLARREQSRCQRRFMPPPVGSAACLPPGPQISTNQPRVDGEHSGGPRHPQIGDFPTRGWFARPQWRASLQCDSGARTISTARNQVCGARGRMHGGYAEVVLGASGTDPSGQFLRCHSQLVWWQWRRDEWSCLLLIRGSVRDDQRV